jgi:nicotinamide-nucleotide amidase
LVILDVMRDELIQVATALNQRLMSKGEVMVSAESCTGGWIAKAMTDVPGSSGCFDRAFVTYSNQAKQEMLGVSAETLDRSGAVSEMVVQQMVLGALEQSNASVAVAVSGIAGPGGGTEEKPVGTVWLAWGKQGEQVITAKELFQGDREQVRYQTTLAALQGMMKIVG